MCGGGSVQNGFNNSTMIYGVIQDIKCFFFIGFDWFYSFSFQTYWVLNIIMAGAYIPDADKIYNII